MADVTISSGDHSIACVCFVVPKGSQRVLFGQDVITKLQLLEQAHVIDTTPVTIAVDPEAIPTAQSARCPPFSVKDEIEAELKRLEEADIIEPVREASAWVSPIVPVRKANGKLRLCVDYRHINKSIIRERHMLPTIEEITAQLDGAQVFSVLDAESGFHQIRLDEVSRPLTTFAAHCGLYRFRRLPFGIACAPEVFQRVVSDIIAGLSGVIVYIDDILVYGSTSEEHAERLQAVRKRLQAANLKLNLGKCQIGKTKVKYLGHWLTDSGVLPDDDKLLAISDMPTPKSRSDVQRFIGMATYLGRFIPDLSVITDPLRRRAKQTPFTVDAEFQQAFCRAKESIAKSLRCLAYFRPEPEVPTAISCDASPCGLGAILWQQDQHGQWLPVSCASRSLTDVETRYSQLEREMLGVVFALQRFRQYVLGREVEVRTDHKPLISIVRKPFDDVPPRLQRWLVSLMPYSYRLVHVPGERLLCVDALSRAPVSDSTQSPAEARSMAEYVGLVLEASPVGLDQVAQATDEDATLRNIMRRVTTSTWSNTTALEEPYLLVRDQLSAADGVLLFNSRVIIPEGLRVPIMSLAHEGHPGREAFQEALRRRVWWPGMTKDATIYAERCSECWRRRTNSHQELLPTEIEGVWEKLAMDIVTIDGMHLLSIVDYGSRYPDVFILRDTSSKDIINALSETFSRFGLPSQVVSDNGPQFVSHEMSNFLGRLGIKHTKSSPRYARSNGMVERFHRVLKERMATLKPHLNFNRRLHQVLFDIRNSHNRMIGTTPNDALFGRVIRTRLPEIIPSNLVNLTHQVRAKARMANDHDAHRGVRSLPSLQPGTRVIMQDGYSNPTQPWRVVEQCGRQVAVTDGRKVLLRNRHHVREIANPQACNPDVSSDMDTSHCHRPTPQSLDTLQPERSSLAGNQIPESGGSTCQSRAGSTSSSPIPESGEGACQPQAGSTSTEYINDGTVAHPVLTRDTKVCPFREGVVTRSGRLVQLSQKAKEALSME